jgi:hypothetical protein
MRRNGWKIGAVLVLILFMMTVSNVMSQQADVIKPPTALKLAVSEKGILLTWGASTDDPGVVTGYEIARAELASGPFKTVAKVKKGAVKYLDKKAKKEIIYYYRVRAVAGNKYSEWSNTVSGERAGF